jgi:hypothetical protein
MATKGKANTAGKAGKDRLPTVAPAAAADAARSQKGGDSPGSSNGGGPIHKSRKVGGHDDDHDMDDPPAATLASLAATLAMMNVKLDNAAGNMTQFQAETTEKFEEVHGLIEAQNARIAAFTSGRDPWAASDSSGTIDPGIHARIDAIETLIKDLKVDQPPAPAHRWAAASSSAGAAGSSGPAHPTRPSGPQRVEENCMVLIHDFPEKLPRAVLRETFNDLVLLLPLHDQGEVKARINQVDNKIIMFFPTSAKADGFLDAFNCKSPAYQDPDWGNDTLLTAKKGRPLAVRRRGGATHPVYEKAETLLKLLPSFESAKLIPNSIMKGGIMQTEFHAGLGRKVTPLFTIFFREEQHETTISSVTFPTDSVFSAPDCEAICAAAGLH